MQAMTMSRDCKYWGAWCSQCNMPINVGESLLCETFYVRPTVGFQQSPSTVDLGLKALKNWDLGLLQIEIQTAVHLTCLHQMLLTVDDAVCTDVTAAEKSISPS